jgi:ketosteroid isomerase-like protein
MSGLYVRPKHPIRGKWTDDVESALMRERYEQFGRGELEKALDLWADDFVWTGDSAGLPWSGRTEAERPRWLSSSGRCRRSTRSP